MVGCLKTGRGNKQDPLLPGFRLLGFLETGKGNKQDPILPVFEVGWVFLETGWGNKQDLITSFKGSR